MNFLVTGGCGYIGTQLTKHLLSKRNKVTIVDNFWFGNDGVFELMKFVQKRPLGFVLTGDGAEHPGGMVYIGIVLEQHPKKLQPVLEP